MAVSPQKARLGAGGDWLRPALERLDDRITPAAVRTGMFTQNTLAANDDSSTGAVPIGFSLNYFGTTYSTLFVNNNGNVTFGAALSTFTPFGLTSNIGTPIIAPFFADVDTTGPGSGLVTYGTGTVNGRAAFGVNYINVGYFAGHTDKTDSFQLVLIDRSDTGAGNFDIEFNYDQIQFETGDASGGTGGLGGNSARVGFSSGTGTPGTFSELPGSGVNGAFLDNGPNSLVNANAASGTPGRTSFTVQNGLVSGMGNRLTAFAAGAGGSATVNVYNPDGSLRFVINANQTFGTDFRGGARVAVGDLTGDGTDDVAVVPGAGGGPVVLVFDGNTGQEVRRFTLTRLGGTDLRPGYFVAIGNVRGGSTPEIVVTPGSTAGPIVDMLDYNSGVEVPFVAYDPNFRGGLRVAVGDVDFAGDGLAEIVVTPGPSGGPVVSVFNGNGGMVNQFLGLDDPNYRGGSFVSVISSASRRTSVIAVTRDSFPNSAGTFLQDTLPDQTGAVPAQALGASQLAQNPADLAVNLFTFNGSMVSPPLRTSIPVLTPSPTGARVAFGQRNGQPGLYVTSGPLNNAQAAFYTYDVTNGILSPVATPVDAGFGPAQFSVYVGAGAPVV